MIQKFLENTDENIIRIVKWVKNTRISDKKTVVKFSE